MHKSDAADMVHFETEANRWITWLNDVPVGCLYFAE